MSIQNLVNNAAARNKINAITRATEEEEQIVKAAAAAAKAAAAKAEAAKAAAAKAEAERVETERVETERVEAAKVEAERVEAAKMAEAAVAVSAVKQNITTPPSTLRTNNVDSTKPIIEEPTQPISQSIYHYASTIIDNIDVVPSTLSIRLYITLEEALHHAQEIVDKKQQMYLFGKIYNQGSNYETQVYDSAQDFIAAHATGMPSALAAASSSMGPTPTGLGTPIQLEENKKLNTSSVLHGGKFNLDNAKRIITIYDNGYEPPEWILNSQVIEPYLESARVYYDGELHDAKELATKREPVNIAMERHYNKDQLQTMFGYKTGVYKEGSQNIAIYTYTPLRTVKGIDLGKSIHIIHAIAPALDSETQADYIEISKLSTPKERQGLYKFKLRHAFQKINKCFKDHNFTTLIMCGIGQNSFYTLSKKLEITDSTNNHAIFNELFTEFFGSNNNVIMNYDDWVTVDGVKLTDMTPSRFIINDLSNRKCKWLEKYTQSELNKILFVNAWDHLSMLGNGNNYDPSTDGFYGRISAISVIGWPLTNPYLLQDDHYIYIKPHEYLGVFNNNENNHN